MSQPNCNKCNAVFTEENRYKTKTKRYNECIDCRNKYAREYAQKRRQKAKEEQKEPVIPDSCSKCETPIESADQWHVPSNQCILCYRKYQREYQKVRRSRPSTVDVEKERLSNCFKCEVVLKTENRYKTTNQCMECYHLLQKQWYEKNKEDINKKYKERYGEDKNFKKYRDYKASLRSFIKTNQKTSKNCLFTASTLKSWLLFCCENMNIDYDRFQTADIVPDHVIPLHIGLHDPTQWHIVSNWYNITPMESNANLVKNKHKDVDIILTHHALLMKYTRINKIIDPNIEIYLSHLQDTSQCSGNP
ncbi:MAG: hypothetical protein ACRCZ0_06560 [Cetobacterium sp.]